MPLNFKIKLECFCQHTTWQFCHTYYLVNTTWNSLRPWFSWTLFTIFHPSLRPLFSRVHLGCISFTHTSINVCAFCLWHFHSSMLDISHGWFPWCHLAPKHWWPLHHSRLYNHLRSPLKQKTHVILLPDGQLGFK